MKNSNERNITSKYKEVKEKVDRLLRQGQSGIVRHILLRSLKVLEAWFRCYQKIPKISMVSTSVTQAPAVINLSHDKNKHPIPNSIYFYYEKIYKVRCLWPVGHTIEEIVEKNIDNILLSIPPWSIKDNTRLSLACNSSYIDIFVIFDRKS